MTTAAATRPVPAVVTAAAVGLAVGTATSWLQGVLPGGTNWLANSGAVWTVVAVAAAWPAARGRGAAVAAGTLALLGEVLGYYVVASPLRGIATSHAEQVLWTAAALVVGPAAGLAAHLVRTGTPGARAAALGAVAGVLAGEGLHALLRLDRPGQASVELALAVLVAATAARPPWRRTLAAAVAAGAPTAALVLLAYGG